MHSKSELKEANAVIPLTGWLAKLAGVKVNAAWPEAISQYSILAAVVCYHIA